MTRLTLLFALVVVALSPWIIQAAHLTGQVHLGRPEAGSNVLAVKGESPPGLLMATLAPYFLLIGMGVVSIRSKALRTLVLVPLVVLYVYSDYSYLWFPQPNGIPPGSKCFSSRSPKTWHHTSP
jgi:hypothetical protein